MTSDVAAIIERARLAADSPAKADAPGADRDRLKRIAAEFESMLLVQMLRDMRRAGSWDEDGESGGGGLGAESLFETLDVELASHLARVRGMGLSPQLEEAFDRLYPGSGPSAGTLPSPGRAVPVPVTSPILSPALTTSTDDEAAQPDTDAGSTNPVTVALKTAAEVTLAAPRVAGAIVRPVAGAVTSAFGWRQHPITGGMKFHQGIDLRAAYGQEVVAAAAGRVVFSGDQGAYGTTVVIQHEDGMRTRYAHLSAALVEMSDRVTAGQPLGRAGQSGRATGPHLHFEVIAADGRRVEPGQWAAGQNPVGNSPRVTAARSIKVRGGGAD